MAAQALPRAFNIPAQPLATALVAYSRTTGIQVLYDSRLRSNRRSSPVVGSFTPDVALQTLLVGTGLLANYTPSGDVVLHQPAAPGSDIAEPPLPDGPVLTLGTLQVQGAPQIGPVTQDDAEGRLYAGVLERDIRQALRQNPRSAGGNYRVLVKLWLARSGTVQRFMLMHSTGDEQRDDAIAQSLRGLTISQPPPASLPQPVGIVLTPGF